MVLHQVLSGRAEEAVPYAYIIYKSLKLLLSFKSHDQTYLFVKEGHHPAASAKFTTFTLVKQCNCYHVQIVIE